MQLYHKDCLIRRLEGSIFNTILNILTEKIIPTEYFGALEFLRLGFNNLEIKDANREQKDLPCK